MEARKVFIGGNWKSNNTVAATTKLIDEVITKLTFDPTRTEVVVAPIFLQLTKVHEHLKDTKVQVAAQNCSLYGFGAYTGQISIEHIKDAGLKWVIIGHSERRTLFGETDEIVGNKVNVVLNAGCSVIACFGETLAEREAGHTFAVVEKQLKAIGDKVQGRWEHVVLAYEPVWAIGTGKVATPEQVTEVHNRIRMYLHEHYGPATGSVRIIYGGSVTEKNCGELIAIENVDGFLVGGASLKPAFTDIVNSAASKKH